MLLHSLNKDSKGLRLITLSKQKDFKYYPHNYLLRVVWNLRKVPMSKEIVRYQANSNLLHWARKPLSKTDIEYFWQYLKYSMPLLRKFKSRQGWYIKGFLKKENVLRKDLEIKHQEIEYWVLYHLAQLKNDPLKINSDLWTLDKEPIIKKITGKFKGEINRHLRWYRIFGLRLKLGGLSIRFISKHLKHLLTKGNYKKESIELVDTKTSILEDLNTTLEELKEFTSAKKYIIRRKQRDGKKHPWY